MSNFILDSVPAGAYVLAYTVKCDPNTCGPSDSITPLMIQALHSIGSNLITSPALTDTILLIVFGRKGAPIGSAHETLSTNKNQLLTQTDSIVTHFTSGFIASEMIGPCMFTDTAWKSLHWHYTDTLPKLPNDTIKIQLFGINASGQKFLRATFPKD